MSCSSDPAASLVCFQVSDGDRHLAALFKTELTRGLQVQDGNSREFTEFQGPAVSFQQRGEMSRVVLNDSHIPADRYMNQRV